MDLIELKSAWNLLQQDILSHDNIEENQILKSIQSKSTSEISQIERSLHLKLIIASVAIIVAIGLAVTSLANPPFNPIDFIFSPKESATFYLVMAISISLMAYFNLKAYRKIRHIQLSSPNLKDNLKGFINAMHEAIYFNIFSDAFMTPIIFAWLYYAYAFKEHQLGLDLRTSLLFILPILIGLLSFFLQRYVQHLRFGQYLDRLISYLDSLQKDSSAL